MMTMTMMLHSTLEKCIEGRNKNKCKRIAYRGFVLLAKME
jgi:hypothetical protein